MMYAQVDYFNDAALRSPSTSLLYVAHIKTPSRINRVNYLQITLFAQVCQNIYLRLIDLSSWFIRKDPVYPDHLRATRVADRHFTTGHQMQYHPAARLYRSRYPDIKAKECPIASTLVFHVSDDGNYKIQT